MGTNSNAMPPITFTHVLSVLVFGIVLYYIWSEVRPKL